MPLRDNWSGAAQYTHLGITLAAAVLLGFFGGYWLDGKIGTVPLFTLIGAFLGATSGFVNLIVTLNQIQKDSEKKNSQDSALR